MSTQPTAAPRLQLPERHQMKIDERSLDQLLPPDHAARTVWAYVAGLDLSALLARIKAVEGKAGQPTIDPRILLSLWLLATLEGVGSARELDRLTEQHIAYEWLCGAVSVNYHTLADFRVEHQQALDRLFIEVLGVLSHQGLITLKRVMHDGTKIKASASDKSFRRQQTLEAHLQEAQKQIEAMGDPRSEQLSQRVAQARKRALREKHERLEQALKELEELKRTRAKELAKQKAKGKEKQLRASTTDPQARNMIQAKGAFGPGYNIQISTDAKAKVIVALGVSQSSSDAGELEAAVKRIESNLGEKPDQMVVDAAYPTQPTIEAMADKGIDLIGPLRETSKAPWDSLKRRGVSKEFYPEAFAYDASTDRYTCPAGKLLKFETQERQKGWVKRRYRARPSDCWSCPFQARCCPESKKGRSLLRMHKTAQLAAFEAKMQTEQARAIYKERAGVAEFPNAWIKDKFGLRQFRLRGVVKVGLEALWACLTYNVCQWIRLCWKPQRLAHA